MAIQASWPKLNFTALDKHKADYITAIQAGLSDNEPMKQLVKQVLRESASKVDD